MVGSFSVGEELVRFVVLIEIVNLVRPTVEDFLGFLRRLTIEAQAVLLKGGKGGDELAELADCLHILRAHICDALNDFGHREQIVDHQLILVLGDRYTLAGSNGRDARKAEEARKQAEAAEAARNAEEARRQAEASRLNAFKVKSETTEEIDPIAEERRRLLKERKRQMRIVENNKGLFALFGKRARRRKAAQTKIEQINKELARLKRR